MHDASPTVEITDAPCQLVLVTEKPLGKDPTFIYFVRQGMWRKALFADKCLHMLIQQAEIRAGERFELAMTNGNTTVRKIV